MSRSILPALSIIVAMLLLALSDNFIEDVARQMSVWQYHAMRGAMLLPAMAAVMWGLGILGAVWPVRPAAVFTRTTFAITALMLYFAAIPVVSISTAAAGLFTSPVFVILISVIVFRERVGPRRWLGVILGFAGVCLVLKIGTVPLRVLALAPMLGGMFYALSIIWVRRYCQQEHPGTMAFWNMAFFVIAGVLGMLVTPGLANLAGHLEGAAFITSPVVVPGGPILGIIAFMGALAAAGMSLLAWGYRSAPSSFAALFDYSFLFWAPLFAWIVRGQTVDTTTAAGMALIFAAGALAMTGLQRQEPAPA